MESIKLDKEQAGNETARGDGNRHEFTKRYFHANWRSMLTMA